MLSARVAGNSQTRGARSNSALLSHRRLPYYWGTTCLCCCGCTARAVPTLKKGRTAVRTEHFNFKQSQQRLQRCYTPQCDFVQ
jgi:hypothetical protein